MLAVRVFVERKLPRNAVAKNLLIPKEINGIPTDVVAIGRIVPAKLAIANRRRYRPLLGGCSGIYTNGTSGTLGYFMRDKKGKKKKGKRQWYALSCAHVLDPGNKKNETLQPSPNDKGKVPQDWAGKLYRSTYKKLDAALSKIDVGARAKMIDLPTPKGTKVVKKGVTVVKSGRTTGVTSGKVTDTGLTLRPPNWGTPPRPVVFRNVIAVEGQHGKFGDGGDSGSLVMHRSGRGAVGILFGRRTAAPWLIYVSPITLVQQAFPAQMIVLPRESYP